MRVRIAAIGLSTVESLPLYHFAPGGTAARLLMVGSDRPLFRCEEFDVCLFGGAPIELELYDVPWDRILARARAWHADVLFFDGLEPLGSISIDDLKVMIEEARRSNMLVAARAIGVSTPLEAVELLDAIVIDYMPDYWYDIALSADAIRVLRHALDSGIWVEVSAYLENPDYRRLHALLLALKNTRVPLHVFVRNHKGGLPLTRFAEKLRVDLEFVYIHNYLYPSLDTLCPACKAPLAARDEGYLRVLELTEDSRCWKCGYPVPFRHVRKKKTPERLLYTLGGALAWYPVDRLAG